MHQVTLPKCPTGIKGLDEISNGGLPLGRPTLITGGAGTGKTLFAVEFLLRGLTDFGEAGVFLTFEESAKELAENVASLGFELSRFESAHRLRIEQMPLQPGLQGEVGDYDLAGLFIRLDSAIEAVQAKRVVIDGIDNLFAALDNQRSLRVEFQRLVKWLKEKAVTTVITSESGLQSLTRHGIEEYLSDCVIALSQRVDKQIATRRLRIVKYRGSAHEPNEYPFILNESGIWVMPITSLSLRHQVSEERISTGIAELDQMLGGKGYYKSSTVLVTGTGGSGKSSMAACFSDAACTRGQRSLYITLEESPEQIIRNMRSIGLDLRQWLELGLWQFHAVRSTTLSLESHLATISQWVEAFQPEVVVVDPITAFESSAGQLDIKIMLMRLVDLFKCRGITALFTSLTEASSSAEQTSLGVSSLVDSWLLLRNLEVGGERSRGLYVLKSRGMAHSNQIREFHLSATGIRLAEVELDAEGNVLVGSARLQSKQRRLLEDEMRHAEITRRKAVLRDRQQALEDKIAALKTEMELELRGLESELALEEKRLQFKRQNEHDLIAQRSGEA